MIDVMAFVGVHCQTQKHFKTISIAQQHRKTSHKQNVSLTGKSIADNPVQCVCVLNHTVEMLINRTFKIGSLLFSPDYQKWDYKHPSGQKMFVCSTYEAKNQIRNSEGYRFLNPQSSATAQIVSLHLGSFKLYNMFQFASTLNY